MRLFVVFCFLILVQFVVEIRLFWGTVKQMDGGGFEFGVFFLNLEIC
jgi:hypothetical protein